MHIPFFNTFYCGLRHIIFSLNTDLKKIWANNFIVGDTFHIS